MDAVPARERWPLVGRDRERARLEAALADARSGRGSVAVLLGDPGIGKTRLAEDLMGRAEDFVRGRGRAWEEGGAPPYFPWVGVLRGLERDLVRRGGSEGAIAPIRSALGLLDPSSDAGASQLSAFALGDRVVEALRGASEKGPLLCFFDDAHWADAATVRLLAFASKSLSDAPVVLLVTARDASESNPLLQPVVDVAARASLAISLGGLGEAAVSALARGVGAEVDAALAARVATATGGNPFFAGEVLLAVGEAPSADGVPDLPLPPTVQSIIERRLAGLGESERAVLEVLAVLGSEAPVSRLSRATPLSTAELLEALEGAARLSFARPLDEGRAWVFAHDLLRATVLSGIPLSRRCALHARIADALEAEGAAVRAERAHHRLRALPVGDVERAVVEAELAARDAKRRHAYDEAASLLERAVAARASGGLAGDERHVALLIDLAETLTQAGDAARTREIALRAAAMARELDDTDGLARAALVYGAEAQLGHVDDVHVALLRDALRRLAPGHVLRPRLLGRLGAAMQPSRTPRIAVALARRGIRLARRAGEPAELLRVLAAARPAFRMVEPRDERLAMDREALALARTQGNELLALRTRMRIGMELLELGELDAAQLDLDATAAEAVRVRQPHIAVFTKLMRGGIELVRGDFASAEAYHASATALVDRLPDPEMLRARTSLWAYALQLMTLRATDDDAVAIRDAPLPGGHQGVAARMLRARLLSDGAAAREIVRGALGTLRTAPSAFSFPSALLPDLLLLVESRELAERLDVEMTPMQGGVAAFPGILVTEGAMDRLRGTLSLVLGRWNEAQERLEQALELNARLGAKPMMARTREILAELEVRRPGGDASKAAGYLAAARDLYESLGMTVPSRRAGEQLTALAGPPPKAAQGHAARAPVASSPRVSFEEQGGDWVVTYDGTVVRERAVNGLRYLAHLVDSPGEPFHVVELLALTHGAQVAEVRGDSGELLDRAAKDAYRRRLRELAEDMDEATERSDLGRMERLRGEMDALEAELSRAFGLGGRERRAGAGTERARANATQRIRDAIRRLGRQNPALGHHLETCVKTGTYCRYVPPP